MTPDPEIQTFAAAAVKDLAAFLALVAFVTFILTIAGVP